MVGVRSGEGPGRTLTRLLTLLWNDDPRRRPLRWHSSISIARSAAVGGRDAKPDRWTSHTRPTEPVGMTLTRLLRRGWEMPGAGAGDRNRVTHACPGRFRIAGTSSEPQRQGRGAWGTTVAWDERNQVTQLLGDDRG